MKKSFVILFVLSFTISMSQTYPVYKIKSGSFDGNTGKFNLTNRYVNMELVIDKSVLYVNDSSYTLSNFNLEQQTETISVRSYDAVDLRNRKCSVFVRFTKFSNEGSSIIVVYPNYIYQYYLKR